MTTKPRPNWQPRKRPPGWGTVTKALIQKSSWRRPNGKPGELEPCWRVWPANSTISIAFATFEECVAHLTGALR